MRDFSLRKIKCICEDLNGNVFSVLSYPICRIPPISTSESPPYNYIYFVYIMLYDIYLITCLFIVRCAFYCFRTLLKLCMRSLKDCTRKGDETCLMGPMDKIMTWGVFQTKSSTWNLLVIFIKNFNFLSWQKARHLMCETSFLLTPRTPSSKRCYNSVMSR